MVHYPNPKFIKKAHMRHATPFVWSAADKRANLDAEVATCLRCAQSIVKQKEVCDKPEHRRCKHCAHGNRGGCSLVSVLKVEFVSAFQLIPIGA